jgi:hypothetical protein
VCLIFLEVAAGDLWWQFGVLSEFGRSPPRLWWRAMVVRCVEVVCGDIMVAAHFVWAVWWFGLWRLQGEGGLLLITFTKWWWWEWLFGVVVVLLTGVKWRGECCDVDVLLWWWLDLALLGIGWCRVRWVFSSDIWFSDRCQVCWDLQDSPVESLLVPKSVEICGSRYLLFESYRVGVDGLELVCKLRLFCLGSCSTGLVMVDGFVAVQD